MPTSAKPATKARTKVDPAPLHFTNLPPIKGYVNVPCVNAQHLSSFNLRKDPIVVIDHESTEAKIAAGDLSAISEAHEVMDEFRCATPAKLGWYWWPPCYASWGVAGAPHFEALVDRADFLAPSFYCATDDPNDILASAKYWLDAISKFRADIRKKPSFGFVCPVQIFSGRACTQVEIRMQVAACKLAKCQNLYVWSGEPAHCNEVLNGGFTPQSALDRQKAIAVLAGRGYRIPSPLTSEALLAEMAWQAKPKLKAFAEAWGAMR